MVAMYVAMRHARAARRALCCCCCCCRRSRRCFSVFFSSSFSFVLPSSLYARCPCLLWSYISSHAMVVHTRLLLLLVLAISRFGWNLVVGWALARSWAELSAELCAEEARREPSGQTLRKLVTRRGARQGAAKAFFPCGSMDTGKVGWWANQDGTVYLTSRARPHGRRRPS
mmetsp:Transcript_28550/g.53516  ORF Transcript_28550/g.53516 Transcript_28550/m.53516 type:complete len:171 (-) Transcript_28550:59-571(-)